MGYGLGKNTPVVLSLARGNFEALIERHGQWLRWRIAKKCPCITTNNRADIHCPKCGGSGDIFDYQREYEDIFRAAVRDNIIPMPEGYSDAEILEVYDSMGRKYEFCRCGDFIEITDAIIPNNELVDVRMRIPTVKRLESAVLEKVGGGYYRVPGISVEPSPLEGVNYQATGDVLSVAELKDSEDKPVNVLGYRRDMVLTDSTAETITATGIEYIMPFRFVVLSQNFSKEDLALINLHNGEAVCTYPYMYNVSENDVLTVLSGTMTHKIAIEKHGNDIDDIIPEFFISQIDSIETKTEAYKEGEDFILVGSNKVHWIGKRPQDTEIMSITYRYFPTYRVAKEIPMLRTSEDQRIPRKVTLKLYAAFAEAKRVNSND
ncbi:MAG: hypothetical protein LBQ89_08210 [Treponema sp.]|nr:hypothetical protein [Treponema sp.]